MLLCRCCLSLRRHFALAGRPTQDGSVFAGHHDAGHGSAAVWWLVSVCLFVCDQRKCEKKKVVR